MGHGEETLNGTRELGEDALEAIGEKHMGKSEKEWEVFSTLEKKKALTHHCCQSTQCVSFSLFGRRCSKREREFPPPPPQKGPGERRKLGEEKVFKSSPRQKKRSTNEEGGKASKEDGLRKVAPFPPPPLTPGHVDLLQGGKRGT